MATNPYSGRLELLQTPFHVRLYGRPIDGVTITRECLNGRIRERSDVRALRKVMKSWHNPKGKTGQATASVGPGLAEAGEQFHQAAEQSASVLANIYAYAQGTTRVVLPRPVTFLVDGDGEDAWGWDELFPSAGKAFKCWEVDPQEVTLRFDTRQGSFDELLLRGEPADQPMAGVTEPDGGTLIRGADNRLYLIPLALEPFEVQNPREVSDLQLQSQYGREIKVDSVRSLTGRSTLVARSTLQVRSTLTLRSTLAAAGRSAGPPTN